MSLTVLQMETFVQWIPAAQVLDRVYTFQSNATTATHVLAISATQILDCASMIGYQAVVSPMRIASPLIAAQLGTATEISVHSLKNSVMT